MAGLGLQDQKVKVTKPTSTSMNFSTILRYILQIFPKDTLLKDRQSSLVSSHPIRILSMCCVYFNMIMKL